MPFCSPLDPCSSCCCSGAALQSSSLGIAESAREPSVAGTRRTEHSQFQSTRTASLRLPAPGPAFKRWEVSGLGARRASIEQHTVCRSSPVVACSNHDASSDVCLGLDVPVGASSVASSVKKGVCRLWVLRLDLPVHLFARSCVYAVFWSCFCRRGSVSRCHMKFRRGRPMPILRAS